MGRGSKAGFKRRTSKRDTPVDRVSDDSDEDYIAAEDEELIESEEEEYASSFDDETEESLAEFEEEEDEDDDDDEEEVYAKKKVKKVARPNKVNLGRKRNVRVKPKRKSWVSYGKEDDNDEWNESDEYVSAERKGASKARKKSRVWVSYGKEDDNDEWNESDEYVSAERKGASKPRKKSRVSYREQEDDDGGDDDDLNDSDEYVGAESKVALKPRKKSRVSYREQEDDGGDGGDDDEYVGAESKGASKPRKKSRVSYREQEDGDDLNESDEYVGAERKGASKARKKSRVSYREQDDDGGDLNESDEYFGAERKSVSKPSVSYREQDDEGDDLNESDEYVGAERKGVSNPSVSYREQDDDGDDLNESDEYVGAERNGVSKPSVYKEQDDDDDNFGDDNDNFDDDDDNDEEFRPDEVLDDIEDEDVMMETKKNKKIGRPPSRKRSIPTRKKTRKVPKVLKRTAKRTRQNCRRKRSSDGELKDTKIRTGQHKKKITGRRGRSVVSDSDSDFVKSRLSEYEYTISEEEREQIQEATEFCRNLSRTLRNSAQTEEREETDSFYRQPKSLRRKGKEPEEQLQMEAAKQVCGICLSEEGRRTIRGTLNCCSHFFCFACIMEWSKVESRCPLCKQRFITISRSAKSDSEFDLRAMVIHVPERDQIYQPSEEELRGYLDPYESVICTECHHGGDDALMLLCDICDSPAHTYCVGLGHEVPEGNWYCEGCGPAAIDSLNSQGLTPTPDNRTTIHNFSGVSSPVDNVRETFDLNEAYVPDMPMTQVSSQAPPRLSGADSQASFTAPGLGASTVSVRRRIQRQIHQIMFIRRQQDSGINTTLSPMSGNSLSRSQIDRVREPAPQHAVSPDVRMTSNHIPFLGRQSYDSGFFHTADALPARSTMRGPMIPHQASTSAASSLDGLSQNGYTVMNRRDSLGVDIQQMHPLNVVSNTGSDASMSPQCREASLPPRTLQGALHTRF